MKTQQRRKQQSPNTSQGYKQKDAYGTPKPDMGGYIGRREGAGDEENPNSMPGGGG